MSESAVSLPGWEEPPPEVTLGDGEVHVWLLRDAAMRAAADRRVLLAQDEEDRAARLQGSRSHAFAATRVSLRILLGRYTGLAPAAIRFEYGPLGKPRLQAGGVHFSVSHAGDRALLAFTSSAPLGVDVEHVRSIRRFDALTARFFSADNARVIALASRSALPRVFAEAWAQREAFVKAVGGGLYATADQLPFEPGRKPMRTIKTPSGEEWTVATLDAGADYEAKLVTTAGIRRIRAFCTEVL